MDADKKRSVLRKAQDYLRDGFMTGSWMVAIDRKQAENVEMEDGEIVFPESCRASYAWSPSGDAHLKYDEMKERVRRDRIGTPNGDACFVCGEGAIYLAAAHADLSYDEARELMKTVERNLPEHYGSIPELNDNTGDADRVIETIERAIYD